MNPRDFLQFSEEIIDLTSCPEAANRSSISRAYYSLFILISSSVLKSVRPEILKRAGLSRQLGHEWLITKLLNSSVREIKEIGEGLHNLKFARNSADYKMDASVTRIEAAQKIVDAKMLHDAIKSFGRPKIVSYLVQQIADDAALRS